MRQSKPPWALRSPLKRRGVAALISTTLVVISCKGQEHPPLAACGVAALDRDAGGDAGPDAAARLFPDGAVPCVGVTGVNAGSVPPGGGTVGAAGDVTGGVGGVGGGAATTGIGGSAGIAATGSGGSLGVGGSPLGAAGADLGLGGSLGIGVPTMPGIGGLGF